MRAAAPLSLRAALLPVAINALLLAGIGVITQSRTDVLTPGLPGAAAGAPAPVLATALAVLSTAVVALIGFAVHVGAVIMIDLFTARSTAAKRRRLVELSGLAYWSQLVWSAPALAAVWWLYDPPQMIVQGTGTAEVVESALRYGGQLATAPLQIVMTQTQQVAAVWLIALHAIALRVVSDLTAGGTWAAGVAMAILFLGFPLAAGEVVQQLLS